VIHSKIPWDIAKENIDRFRSRYLAGDGIGGTIERVLDLLAAELATAVYDDDIFFGLAVLTLSPFLKCATVYEVLEHKIDNAFVENFEK
jgi:hypothetical protein